eukprot:394683_1
MQLREDVFLMQKKYNALYGFAQAFSGVAYEGPGWITPWKNQFSDDWVLSSTCTDLYRGNGEDFTKPGVDLSLGMQLASNLNINNHFAPPSDWACAEIIVVNERLNENEIQCVEDYFSCKYD